MARGPSAHNPTILGLSGARAWPRLRRPMPYALPNAYALARERLDLLAACNDPAIATEWGATSVMAWTSMMQCS